MLASSIYSAETAHKVDDFVMLVRDQEYIHNVAVSLPVQEARGSFTIYFVQESISKGALMLSKNIPTDFTCDTDSEKV